MRCLLPIQLLAFTVSIYPQQPVAPGAAVSASAQEERELCKLEGRVVNALTGAPVRRVKLTLRDTSQPMTPLGATTDAEGRFSFENIEPGTHRLHAQRTGFVDQAYGARTPESSGTPLTLLPGQVLKDLEFKLTPQGVITGTVLYEEGEPVERAYVSAYRQRDFGSRLPTIGGDHEFTNDLGEFRIANLAPGRYIVSAQQRAEFLAGPAIRPADEDPKESYITTYYLSSTDPTGAVPVEVEPGQEVSGIEIILRKGRVYRVEGEIAGVAPAQFRSLMLTLIPRERSGPMTDVRRTVVKPDGSFEILDVRPGAYNLMVNPLGVRDRERYPVGRMPVDVMDNNVKGLLLHLTEPLEVTGTVRVEGQEKVTFDRTRVSLRAVEAVSFSRAAPVNADGIFKMGGVFPGKHYLNFYGLPEGTYVRSARMGNQEVLDKGLDLSQMQSVPAIEVILSPKAGMVEGTVQEEEGPAPGGWVVLIPDPVRPEQSYLSKAVTADQNGRFTIKGVAPGDYNLYAWREMQYEVLREPELLKPFESDAVEVTIEENSRQQVELTTLNPEEAPKE